MMSIAQEIPESICARDSVDVTIIDNKISF
jgi:hypothetical protein